MQKWAEICDIVYMICFNGSWRNLAKFVIFSFRWREIYGYCTWKYRNSVKSLQHRLIIAHNNKCCGSWKLSSPKAFTQSRQPLLDSHWASDASWGTVLVLTIPNYLMRWCDDLTYAYQNCESKYSAQKTGTNEVCAVLLIGNKWTILNPSLLLCALFV